MLIVNCVPMEIGWSPIQHMITLAARVMESSVVSAAPGEIPFSHKLLAILRPRTRGGRNLAHESCLLVCAGPADLVKLLALDGWRRFGFLAAWVIDSFWLEHFSATIRLSRLFDHLFITSLQDVGQWQRITRAPVSWLPWGSDVLGLGSDNPNRTWDVMRVGRQPPEWDDDLAACRAAESLGISYRGRPPRDRTAVLQNHAHMMRAYAEAKYVLAFSNRVNPEPYTHPEREYLTGRWVDALACGATVAGVTPRFPGVDELLWPGAALDLGTVSRSAGLAVLQNAVRAWTPEQVRRNHALAREKLDWRRRLRVIADACGESPATLSAELKLL